ncbi:major facilitator superfamily domain-containing protein [Xylaria sp. FL0933]|nr:major facilitator superfamily domain-containing protein [Xylaria sp. FL0933]
MLPAGSPESDITIPSSEYESDQAPAGKGWRAVFFAVYFTTLLAAIDTAFLPCLGQLCNFFGRRCMMPIVVALFVLGSGISGRASSAATLIGGRVVQGIGGGGINLLIELIVSDLVSQRERGAYSGIVFGVFWINLPVAGVALILHFLFLRVNYGRETAILTKLKRINYAGNAILIASVVAYPWSSYHVLVTLIVGIFGLVLHIYDGMPWVREHPTLPERVFKPVPGISPAISGVKLLPTVLLSVVTGAIAALLLSRWGRYRPLHISAFSLISLGLDLFSRFDRHTHPAELVLVQAVAAFGLGIVMFTNLSSVQADLPDSDTAAATAAFAFMRAYGSIWGGGNAYSFANADYVRSFPEPQRDRVSLGFALLGFLLCFLQKEISLLFTIDTEFGLEQKRRSTDLEGNREKEPVILSA